VEILEKVVKKVLGVYRIARKGYEALWDGVDTPYHPRRESLLIREKLAEGFRRGIEVPQGLMTHSKGECFDYLLGERTTEPASKALEASAAALLPSNRPSISVNGNTDALIVEDLIRLSRELGAP